VIWVVVILVWGCWIKKKKKKKNYEQFLLLDCWEVLLDHIVPMIVVIYWAFEFIFIYFFFLWLLCQAKILLFALMARTMPFGNSNSGCL
jgi:hypothetical protein